MEAKAVTDARKVYIRDKSQYDVEDKWVVPEIRSNGKVYGDCEDLALFTRQRALERNIPSESMYFVRCNVDKEAHVMLILYDDGIQYVADSRFDGVTLLSDNDCRNVMMFSFDNQFK
jgi:predicted transglutaminase-like cysteine proteinase